MKLQILGTTSPTAKPDQNCIGYLITEGKNKILIDAGSGCHKYLNYPKDLNNFYAFISHLHRDHYNDIYNIQYASFVHHNLKNIEKPIDIFLPATPENRSNDLIQEKEAYSKYTIINENSKIKIGNIYVEFCQTDHPVETYAMKFSEGEKSIVYTADTSFSSKDKLVNFAKDADLLLSESSLLEKWGFPEINSHLTAKQAAIIAKEANCKVLMLTHFWPDENPKSYVEEARAIFPRVIAAKEGLAIDFPRIHPDNLESQLR